MIYNLETVLKYYIVIVSVVDALHFSQLFLLLFIYYVALTKFTLLYTLLDNLH